MQPSPPPPAKREALRKLIHVILALALLVPLSPGYASLAAGVAGDPALSTYALLLVATLFASTLRVRRPELRDVVRRVMRDARRAALQHLEASAPLHRVAEEVERALSKVEEGFFSLIDAVERDYEKRHGYVAAVCALASALASYSLFGPQATARGILALAIVDPAASLLTLYLPRGRRLLKHRVHAPLLAALLFSAVLLTLGDEPRRAAILGLAAALVELLSVEDNLTLPLAVAALHRFLTQAGGAGP